MKKKVLILAVFACAALISVLACGPKSGSSASAPAKFTATQVSDYSAGTNAQYLGGAHLAPTVGATCESCHGETGYVQDSELAINANCESCHGDYAAMTAISAEKLGEAINPHGSHLGQVNCTSCHASHEPSYVYCNYCHAFDELEIAFAGPQPKFTPFNPADFADAKPNRVEEVDVVVIGSGGAGMVSAISIHDAGGSVVVVEKMPIPGGNTQLSAGGMNAAWTTYQKDKNITDSPDVMYDDTMKGGSMKSIPALVRVLADQSNTSMEWLKAHGIILNNPGMGGGAKNARFHAPEDGSAVGAYLTKHLKQLGAERNLDVRVNSRVVKILTDKTGAVTGVLVDGKHNGIYEIRAKSVIDAAGGFSSNAELVAKYQPAYAGMISSNQPGAQGEGMTLGELVGGRLIDMEQIQIHPTVAVGSQILITEAVRGRGAILVSHNGVRIMDEMTTRDKASAAILAQDIKTAYLIFDDATLKALKQIEGYFHLGLVKEGNTPEELAAAIKVPPAALKNTITRYNGFVKAGKDADFGRASLPQQLNTGKYYAIEIAPGVHYTMGGLEINADAQVINKEGQPIKNLYAAGEVTGGVHGTNRLGGNSISETITFGRISGTNALKNAE